MTGLAFELHHRDVMYTAPNRSLSSMAAGRIKGNSKLKRGFWGDVANSPYVSVGLECNDPRLTKKKSSMHVKSACDVAYYNIVRWLTMIETGKDFAIKEDDVDAFFYGASTQGGDAIGAIKKGFLKKGQQVASEDAPSLEEVMEESGDT